MYCGKKSLKTITEKNKIDFVIANGENAAIDGVGITENNVKELISSGVDVVTTGNHVWDQKETFEFIKKEKRLLTVSYTHLRAHETLRYLVCRLLLEKKK